MVRAMITTADRHCRERLADASVVTAVVDIPGACHEVLPPRWSVASGLPVQPTIRAAPP